MDKNVIRAFEEDFYFFSDEYFKDASHLKKIEKYQTSKEELVAYQREFVLSYDTNKAHEIIASKSEPNLTFCLNYTGPIFCVYDPDYDYLAKLVSFFEELLLKGNEPYLDWLILKQPADFYGASCRNEILTALVLDNKYFWSPSQQTGPRQIVAQDRRFAGLLPFLFTHQYMDLYERMFKFCLYIFKRFSNKTGKMVLSLLNFLKMHDQKNYVVFKKEFDEMLEKDKSVWNKALGNGEYGHGFLVNEDYWQTPFLETLE